MIPICFLCIAFAVSLHAETRPTFNRDIAPIIFGQCVACHHPGGLGPFSLTNYAEVKKRAKLIVQVTARRIMPPWLPEPGHGDFLGERRLSSEQIAAIARWVKASMPEGAAHDLKVKPEWNDDWQLGKPDLVVTMPEAYTLPAEGRDIYRNFVIPNAVPKDHYVRAVEIAPGNRRVVHHAVLFVNENGAARERAKKETEPGYDGMNPGRGTDRPGGHILSWQPGKRVLEEPAGTSWLLHTGADLVLQLHLRPGGKPEKVQASVALYFTDNPVAHDTVGVMIRSTTIDIPAGTANYAAESSYTLPVGMDVVGAWPHMHYLGREAHGWAELPDGTQKELILIRRWDFNWQGDYRYAEPIFLPKGATVRMHYTYDNTVENVFNPNHPPKRVLFGPQTSDEMGELTLTFLPRSPEDADVFRRDYESYLLQDDISCAQAMLRIDPKDAESRTDLGEALHATGKTDEAIAELKHALQDNPKLARAHYVLSVIFGGRNDLPNSKAELVATLNIDPNDSDARNNYGWLLLVEGNVEGAIEQLEQAVRLNPKDALAQSNLQKAKAMRKR